MAVCHPPDPRTAGTLVEASSTRWYTATVVQPGHAGGTIGVDLVGTGGDIAAVMGHGSSSVQIAASPQMPGSGMNTKLWNVLTGQVVTVSGPGGWKPCGR